MSAWRGPYRLWIYYDDPDTPDEIRLYRTKKELSKVLRKIERFERETGYPVGWGWFDDAAWMALETEKPDLAAQLHELELRALEPA